MVALAKTFPHLGVDCSHCGKQFSVPAGYTMLICPPTTAQLDAQLPTDITKDEKRKMPAHLLAAVQEGATRRRALARQLATSGINGKCDEELAGKLEPTVHTKHFACDDRGHWVECDEIAEAA